MKGIIRELFGFIVFIVIVAAVSYFVVAFVGQRTQVSGESMETTLADGDHLVMNNPGLAAEPITLGADEYFVLGDNRNNSQDSRSANVGVIHRDELLGRAWIRIWPLDKFGVIKHE